MSHTSPPPLTKPQFHWHIFRQRLKTRKTTLSASESPYLSHRSITTYHLVTKTLISHDAKYETHTYKFPNGMRVRLREKVHIDLRDIANRDECVDNTGNTGIWLSEEVLAYMLVKGVQNGALHWRDRRDGSCTTIMELGCGVALAGFALYQSLHGVHRNNTSNTTIILSDGNKQVCSNAQWNYDNIIAPRYPSLENLQLHIACIPWQHPEAYQQYHNTLDFVFISDCLFFKDFHEHLLDLLDACLRRDGEVWILAPERPPTMRLFLERAEKRGTWDLQMKREYDAEVHNAARRVREEYGELFDESLHVPMLLVLRRRGSGVLDQCDEEHAQSAP